MSKNSNVTRFSASKLQTYQNFQTDLVTLLNDGVACDYAAVGSSSGEEISEASGDEDENPSIAFGFGDVIYRAVCCSGEERGELDNCECVCV